jgi:hypothetical protein
MSAHILMGSQKLVQKLGAGHFHRIGAERGDLISGGMIPLHIKESLTAHRICAILAKMFRPRNRGPYT